MKLRASSLPGWNDCARRSAARLYPKLLAEHGIVLRTTLPSIGAAVGTATHAVAEAYYTARLRGVEFDSQAALDRAMDDLIMEVAPGAEFDDSTPNVDIARGQVRQLATTYIESVGATLEPLAIEQSLQADLGDGWILTGHIDLVARVDGHDAVQIRDLKTGSVARSYHGQLGAYSLLYRSNNPETVTRLVTDYVKRVGYTKPPAPVVSTDYDVDACERNAFATIERVKGYVAEFEKTGDINAWPENPMSMMCGEKFCPAFNTDFCPLTKQ